MLTQRQLTTIIINAIAVKMLITFPATLFRLTANGAWLSGIYVTLVAVGVFGIIRRIYPQKDNIITLSEKLFGSFGRIVTGILVFLTLFINLVPIMRIFPEIIKLVLLQKTYIEIIVIVLTLALIFCASCGVDAVARVVEMVVPIAGIVFVAFLLMLLPNVRIDYILPLFGNGAKSILYDGLSAMSIFADLLLLNILIPRTKNLEGYKRSGTNGIIIGGGVATLILLFYGLCYVWPASGNFLVPIYQLERLINLGDFFSRLEAFYRFVWSIMILLYLAVYIGVLAEVWREAFCLDHSKPLVAPVVITLVGVSLIPQPLQEMVAWEMAINKWIYLPAFLLPIAAALAYKWKMFHVKHLKEKK